MDNLLLNPNTQKKFFDRGLLITSLVSFFVAGIVFGYFMLENDGISSICADYNLQSVPFTMHINDYIKHWQGEWDWSLDLGAPFVTGYSFYNLFSPFLWLTLPFPASWIPYLMNPLYAFKFMVAAALAYTYLKMFVKNNNFAVIGALLYAFSGFIATSIVFQFIDVIALFPLLLVGLEKYMSGGKPCTFIFAIFINCITNYFIFVSEVIFVILYFLFRYWKLNRNEFAKKIFKCLLCGIIGVGLSSFAFLPSIYYVLGSDRASAGGVFYIDNLYYSVKDALAILKGYFFPPEAMNNYSTFFGEKWDALSTYLPLFGFSLVLAFYLKDSKAWISKLSIILIVLGFSPIATSLFYCGTISYHRWQFMLVMLFALMSSYVLDNVDNFNVKKSIWICLGIVIIFTLTLLLLPANPFSENHYNIIDAPKFIYQVLSSIFSLLIALMLFEYKKSSNNERLLTVLTVFLVSIASLISLAFVYKDYDSTFKNHKDSYNSNLYISDSIPKYDDQYRYLLYSESTAVTSIGNLPGIESFSSSVSSSTYKMYQNLGFSFTDVANRTVRSEAIKGATELLGGKYLILKSDGGDLEGIIDSFDYNGKHYCVVEKDAAPIGYLIDSYVKASDYLKTNCSKHDIRGVVALQNLIVEEDDVLDVSKFVVKSDILSDVTKIDNSEQQINSLVEIANENKVDSFSKTNNGFTCIAKCDSDKAAFFSIPFDIGWSANVNGEKVDIYDSNGLMYILLPKGDNVIEFTYRTPLLRLGIIISLISAIICLLNGVIGHLLTNRRKKV